MPGREGPLPIEKGLTETESPGRQQAQQRTGAPAAWLPEGICPLRRQAPPVCLLWVAQNPFQVTQRCAWRPCTA